MRSTRETMQDQDQNKNPKSDNKFGLRDPRHADAVEHMIRVMLEDEEHELNMEIDREDIERCMATYGEQRDYDNDQR